MYIQYITIRNFGAVRSYHTQLSRKVNLLDSRHADEIATAVSLLLCNKSARAMPPVWLREDSLISAAVYLENIRYCVSLKPVTGRLQLFVTDPTGIDATAQYQYILSRCLEQDTVESFDGRDSTTPLCLHQYWCREAEGLPNRTEGVTNFETFRSYLHSYIHEFCPEPINHPKRYRIAIDSQGKFTVNALDHSGKIYLSETEEKLFHYSCFLHIVEFWAGFEKLRNLHYEKKPLLIRNFLELLDDSINVQDLIKRTKKLQRQILIFTLPQAAIKVK